MSTDATTNGAATAAPPAPVSLSLNQPLNWYQKLVTLWEVNGIQRIRQEQAANMKLVQKTQNGTIGQPDPAGVADTMPGDISVGDQIHYHYPAAGTPTGTPTGSPPPVGGLAKWILPAVLGAATGGLGTALWPAISGLMGGGTAAVTPTTPAPPAVAPDDPNYVAPGINLKLYRQPPGGP